MANIRNANAISNSISVSGQALLNAITQDTTIWDTTRIDYYYGSGAEIDWESNFRASYDGAPAGQPGSRFVDGSTPDATFAYLTQMEQGFDMIDSVVSISFQRNFTSAYAQDNAELVLFTSINIEQAGLEGFHQFPGTTHRGVNLPLVEDDWWSVGVFNSANGTMNTAPEVGGGEYLNWTLLHEVGHGLGLLHTHQEVAGQPALVAVGEAMDNERYSVMSYSGASTADAYGHAVSLMALDIAALQQQYGAESYATGNSTYTLTDAGTTALSVAEGAVTIGRAYFSIWDSGGNSDTITYGGANSVMINLNDATLDRVTSGDAAPAVAALQNTTFYGSLSTSTVAGINLQDEATNTNHTAGGFFSRVLTEANGTYSAIDGGFSIAYGAVIENAIGGEQDDALASGGEPGERGHGGRSLKGTTEAQRHRGNRPSPPPPLFIPAKAGIQSTPVFPGFPLSRE